MRIEGRGMELTLYMLKKAREERVIENAVIFLGATAPLYLQEGVENLVKNKKAE